MARPRCNCGRLLLSRAEKERGHCATCEVASWPESKRKKIREIIGRAFRGDQDGAERSIDEYLGVGEDE